MAQRAHDAGRLRAAPGVTSVPASNFSRLRTLTGVVCVRNGPIGIDILLFEPGSLPSRM